MAKVVKDLVLMDEFVALDIPTDMSAMAGVQLATGAPAGTIVLEGRILDNDWFAIGMKKPADDTAITNLIAPGAGYAMVSYCDAVRVRKSSSGAGTLRVALQVSKY